jgi:hypothetical protein
LTPSPQNWRHGRVSKLPISNVVKKGDQGKNAVVALFERSISENIYKKSQKFLTLCMQIARN